VKSRTLPVPFPCESIAAQGGYNSELMKAGGCTALGSVLHERTCALKGRF
jgi:hypothetical protein